MGHHLVAHAGHKHLDTSNIDVLIAVWGGKHFVQPMDFEFRQAQQRKLQVFKLEVELNFHL